MRNTSYLITLALGFALVVGSGLGLIFSLNINFLNSVTFFQIGKIEEIKGSASVAIFPSKSFDTAAVQDLVYSNQTYKFQKGSSLKLSLGEDEITIVGPASFSFRVVDPNIKEVFVNFSEFTEVQPKLANFKNLKLTYKGWMIEPFFNKESLEESVRKELHLSKISTAEAAEEEASSETENEGTREEKSNYLEELVSIKRPLLKKCYENYLKTNPLATGKLVVEFIIETSGKVSSTRIKDSSFFKDTKFKTCIKNVFLRIKSKPFAGESIRVDYPIEFE